MENNDWMQGGPMKPKRYHFCSIPGKVKSCLNSGHDGHSCQPYYASPKGPKTMRNQAEKGSDRHSAEALQSYTLAMGLQWGVMKNRPHTFFIFMVAAVASTTFTYPAHAGRYELIKGRGVEVCEAYEKNLNSLRNPWPMNCEREVSQKFKEFSKPKWQRVDAIKNFALVWTVDEFLQPDLHRQVSEGYLDNLKQRAQNEGSLREVL